MGSTELHPITKIWTANRNMSRKNPKSENRIGISLEDTATSQTLFIWFYDVK